MRSFRLDKNTTSSVSVDAIHKRIFRIRRRVDHAAVVADASADDVGINNRTGRIV